MTIRTWFQTMGTTRLADGWLLIFMIYSTLLPRAWHVCFNRLFETMPPNAQLAQEVERPAVNHEVVGSSLHSNITTYNFFSFTFQSSFHSRPIRCLFSKTRSITVVFHLFIQQNNFSSVYVWIFMSVQEPASHYRLGLKLGTYCDNATRCIIMSTETQTTRTETEITRPKRAALSCESFSSSVHRCRRLSTRSNSSPADVDEVVASDRNS